MRPIATDVERFYCVTERSEQPAYGTVYARANDPFGEHNSLMNRCHR